MLTELEKSGFIHQIEKNKIGVASGFAVNG
jgi:hypothetical protein